jgi:hypothetical protein
MSLLYNRRENSNTIVYELKRRQNKYATIASIFVFNGLLVLHHKNLALLFAITFILVELILLLPFYRDRFRTLRAGNKVCWWRGRDNDIYWLEKRTSTGCE